MKNEITIQKQLELNIQGVQVNKNSLVISEDATELSIKKIGVFLSSVGRSSLWWLGDYCVALQKRNPDSKKLSGWYNAEGAAEAFGMSTSTASNAASVSRFYPPESRTVDLEWSKYLEAKQVGDLPEAIALLELAHKNGWSVSDIRKHVRLRNATAPEVAGSCVADTGEVEKPETKIQDPGPVKLGLSELYAADRWARDLDADFNPDPDEVKTLLERTKNLRAWLKTLEEMQPIDV